jgi:bisphosphoglycerate-independent phosphoglycerate mutase (AlkP superfamily)
VLFNFRGDRALEITRAFEQADLTCSISHPASAGSYAGMLEYDGDLHIPARYWSPAEIQNTLGERLAQLGISQLAISETQNMVMSPISSTATAPISSAKKTKIMSRSCRMSFPSSNVPG